MERNAASPARMAHVTAKPFCDHRPQPATADPDAVSATRALVTSSIAFSLSTILLDSSELYFVSYQVK